MTADIRLAVSVIQTVFAQNHRAAATAADDHANTPNNKKSPSPSLRAERGAMLHVGAKYSNRNSTARFLREVFDDPPFGFGEKPDCHVFCGL